MNLKQVQLTVTHLINGVKVDKNVIIHSVTLDKAIQIANEKVIKNG
jgi:hypothetical protein